MLVNLSNINLNRYVLSALFLLASLPFATAQSRLVSDKDNRALPQAVLDMTGTYAGSWTMYGIDAEGQVLKYSSWTDTVKAENPQLDGDQAYVLATDEMIFEDSNIPPMKVTWKEGYFVLPDGTPGDQFIETFGQTTRVIQLSENVWTSATQAHAEELASLGFPNVTSGQHVTTKVVSHEKGIETHRVTRVTTVNWMDQAGQDRWIQFVSLQGFHQRQLE